MSSHHFVREEQSACLYVVSKDIDEDLFSQLLEWNPVIIATSNSFEWLMSKKIRIDYLQTNDTEIETPYSINLVNVIGQIEMIKYLDQNIKSDRITVVGSFAKEETLAFMLKAKNTKLTIIENRFKHFLVLKGRKICKWMRKGEVLNFYPNNDFTLSNNVEQINNRVKALSDSKITIHTHSNIIFRELL